MKKFVYSLFVLLSLLSASYAQHPNVMLGNQRDPNEPSIIINPKNTNQMMAGANIDNYYASDDGGLTWTNDRLFSSTLGVWGDPCMAVDTLGSFYFFHLSNPPGAAWIDRIVCQRTDNLGATFNNGSGIGLNGSKNQDKEWVVVDRSTNRLYVSWTQFDQYNSANPADSSIIRISHSDDQGESWSEPVRINKVAGDCLDGDNTVEGAVPAIGPQGQVYVSWAGPEGLLFDKSFDGGETWLNDDIQVSDLPGGWDFSIPGISRANGFPVTACDLSGGPHHGTIYINWSDQRNGLNDTDIWLSKSTDGGDTWSPPLRVNDDLPGKHQFFNWMAIDQVTGRIWIVFYDRRNYTDTNTDVYLAMSEDGGANFVNFRVSESPFIPNPTIFFGDYNNIAAHNNVVRPVWTRLHQNELSIYTAIVDTTVVQVPDLISEKPFAQLIASPNPFAQSAAISFKLHHETKVSLIVRDIMGRQIMEILHEKSLPAGKYIEKLDASKGLLVPGVYMLNLITESGNRTFKIVYSP